MKLLMGGVPHSPDPPATIGDRRAQALVQRPFARSPVRAAEDVARVEGRFEDTGAIGFSLISASVVGSAACSRHQHRR